MAIVIKEEDVTFAEEDIIAHAVNGEGKIDNFIMESFAHEFPKAFKHYLAYVEKIETKDLAGRNLMVGSSGNFPHEYDPNDGSKLISYLFTQTNSTKNNGKTDYAAIEHALNHLKNFADTKGLSIALPYGIGAEYGGGDWDKIVKIIEKVFKESEVALYKHVDF